MRAATSTSTLRRMKGSGDAYRPFVDILVDCTLNMPCHLFGESTHLGPFSRIGHISAGKRREFYRPSKAQRHTRLKFSATTSVPLNFFVNGLSIMFFRFLPYPYPSGRVWLLVCSMWLFDEWWELKAWVFRYFYVHWRLDWGATI